MVHVRRRALAVVAGAWLVASTSAGCRTTAEIIETLARGEERQLRTRTHEAPRQAADGPPILIIALDGVNARTLYDALGRRRLPGLATLLGGTGLEHAYLHSGLVVSLPSISIGVWATAFTGVPPAVHGLVGNEFFVRQTGAFVAPWPVSYSDFGQVLSTHNERTLDAMIGVPTVYERLREREPNIRIWVANHPITRGADKLISAEASALFETLGGILSQKATPPDEDDLREVPAELDEETFDSVLEELEEGPVPDVLIVYLAGPDQYAHEARMPPKEAIEEYLNEALDARFLELHAALESADAMRDRYVVVVSDHGHTDVVHDERHALGRKDGGAVQDVLSAAGFVPRPNKRDVDEAFSAVVAYAGAMALVYVADRSRCHAATGCDWRRPPRRNEDVLAAAEAIHRAARDADSPLSGALDMVLVRTADADHPFEVYLGGGRTTDVVSWLEAHPRPSYIRLPERLRDLASGPRGDRAGDIVLIANNGNRDEPVHRFYFDQPAESWHGSPSANDSIVPLIVAHGDKSREQLAETTLAVVDELDDIDRLVDLVLHLRRSSPGDIR